MRKQSLIIVGAGAAGLYAGSLLANSMDVIILEAQGNTGGRIQPVNLNGQTMEAGAEFIHGDVAITAQLLKEAGINKTKVSGKMYRHANGKFIEDKETDDGWDLLLERIRLLQEDTTVEHFLQEQYSGENNAAMRQQVIQYAQGFDVADTTKASIKSLYREWSAEGEDTYRVSGGYHLLMGYLCKKIMANGGRVMLSKPVRQVDWQAGHVKVYTKDGEYFYADKLLVTVSAGVLASFGSKGAINFTPELNGCRKAAGNIGFGPVIKILLQFKKPFWQDDAGFIITDGFIPTWWTQLPEKTPILTGWTGGPAALSAAGYTNDELLQKAMASLAKVYTITVEMLKDNLLIGHVFNWHTHTYTMGAYSYDMLQSADAKRLLSTPIQNTIFFAGEAVYNGDHPGTVEAAFVSARATVAKIVKR